MKRFRETFPPFVVASGSMVPDHAVCLNVGEGCRAGSDGEDSCRVVVQWKVKTDGFTLLEVIVAVVLIGIIFGTVFEAYSLTLKNVDKLDISRLAMQYAQNKMDEFLVDDSVFRNEYREGRWNDHFSWKAQFTVADLDDPKVKLETLTNTLVYIRLTVTYTHQGREKNVKLFSARVALRPKPAQQPAAVTPGNTPVPPFGGGG